MDEGDELTPHRGETDNRPRDAVGIAAAATAGGLRSRSESLGQLNDALSEVDASDMSPVPRSNAVDDVDAVDEEDDNNKDGSMPSDETTDPWWDDHVVPRVSTFRSTVLRFLSPASKLACALGNEAWYDAATQWEAWQPDFTRADFVSLCVPAAARGERYRHYSQDPDMLFVPTTSPGLLQPEIVPMSGMERKECNNDGGFLTTSAAVRAKGLDCGNVTSTTDRDPSLQYFRRSTFGSPMRFDSPLMYSYVLNAARLSTPQMRLMLPTIETPFRSFVGAFAALFGRNDLRCEEQYPVAHILLRHPTFLALADAWVLSPGYGNLPPYLILLAHITRWYLKHPAFADVFWLISFGHWVATARDPTTGGKPMPFHKLLIAPLLAVASSTTARLNRIHQYWALVEATLAVIHRYLDEAISVDAAERARRRDLIQLALEGKTTPPPPPCEDVEILPDTDPRLCFSVLQHLRMLYVKMRPALDARVKEELGEYGVDQLRAAEARLTVLMKARALHEEVLP